VIPLIDPRRPAPASNRRASSPDRETPPLDRLPACRTIRAVRHRLLTLDHDLAGAGVAPALTIVLILTSVPNRWVVATPLIAAVAVAAVWPSILRGANLWCLIGGALAAGLHDRWFAADNHHYLVLYWTAAIALSTRCDDPAVARRRSARWLIAAVFSLAFLGKVVSSDFVSGDFIEFTLLTDDRFAWLAASIAGVAPSDLANNRDLVTAVVGPNATDAVMLAGGSPRLSLVADLVTWWTLLIEGLVATAFLVRPSCGLGRARDWLLIGFVATTYLAAPVVGFGWILAILGIAAVEPGSRADGRRLGYLAVLLLVRFAATPWDDAVLALLG
jgi:hypothetical protein